MHTGNPSPYCLQSGQRHFRCVRREASTSRFEATLGSLRIILQWEYMQSNLVDFERLGVMLTQSILVEFERLLVMLIQSILVKFELSWHHVVAVDSC